MKKILALVLGLLTWGAMAQKTVKQQISSDNDKLTIHVETDINGKKEVYNRTINTKNMSPEQRHKLIDSFADSVSTGAKKNERIRIKIDTDKPNKQHNNTDSTEPELEDIDIDIDLGGADYDFKDLEQNLGNMSKTLKFKFDEFAPKLEKLGMSIGSDMEAWARDLEKKIKEGNYSFDMGGSGNSKTIRNLTAYPNKPANGRLNVKFFAAEKTNVTITVTDLNGKVIGSEKLPEFSGDYIGQIELKGSPKGTLFVTVAQGDDGAVKRIVLE
jgi:hypothetical protein